MHWNRLIHFGILGLLCFSCSVEEPVKYNNKNFTDHIIHPLYFYFNQKNKINFPVWFNDSVISVDAIRRITITDFEPELINDDIQSSPCFPHTKWNYTFNDAGLLTRVQRILYHRGIALSKQTYFVSAPSDFGYVSVLAANKQTAKNTDIELFQPLAVTERLRTYKANNGSQKVFFLTNEYFTSPLSVDTIAHPSPKDQIILGNAFKPTKMYQVKNLMKENNSYNFSYFEKNFPEKIDHVNYPFNQTTLFYYSNDGFLTVMKTFEKIESELIRENRTVFKYNVNHHPIELITLKKHPKADHSVKIKTTIQYKKRF